jgi:hypothetical protein
VETSEAPLRDIDQIIDAVRQQIPELTITQWHKSNPGDDDGIWWFRLPGVASDVQVENCDGMCPFLIETDEQSSFDARRAYTVPEAIEMIVSYLLPLREP